MDPVKLALLLIDSYQFLFGFWCSDHFGENLKDLFFRVSLYREIEFCLVSAKSTLNNMWLLFFPFYGI